MDFINLEKALNEISQDILLEYKNQLGDSKLAESISISVQKFGDNYEIVLSLEDYWIYVENGRKAGKMPPVSSILKWVKEKPIQLQSGVNGKLKTPEQTAFAIATGIKQHGTKGKHYLSKSLEKIEQSNLSTKLAEALAKDIDEYLLQTLNNK